MLVFATCPQPHSHRILNSWKLLPYLWHENEVHHWPYGVFSQCLSVDHDSDFHIAWWSPKLIFEEEENVEKHIWRFAIRKYLWSPYWVNSIMHPLMHVTIMIYNFFLFLLMICTLIFFEIFIKNLFSHCLWRQNRKSTINIFLKCIKSSESTSCLFF